MHVSLLCKEQLQGSLSKFLLLSPSPPPCQSLHFKGGSIVASGGFPLKCKKQLQREKQGKRIKPSGAKGKVLAYKGEQGYRMLPSASEPRNVFSFKKLLLNNRGLEIPADLLQIPEIYLEIPVSLSLQMTLFSLKKQQQQPWCMHPATYLVATVLFLVGLQYWIYNMKPPF